MITGSRSMSEGRKTFSKCIVYLPTRAQCPTGGGQAEELLFRGYPEVVDADLVGPIASYMQGFAGCDAHVARWTNRRS
jgi:hypothetical protein